MELMSFYDEITKHPDLIGLEVDLETGTALVEHLPTKIVTRISKEAIERQDWSVLSAILTLQRDPAPLVQLTRVCGYYSLTQNWNKSKLGELKDRRRGTYALAEETAPQG